MDHDHITGFHLADVTFDGQGTSIFHRVEENGGDLAAQHNATITFVRYVGDIVTHMPKH